jgi:regulator of protease activity HflC (stomatin/prohibitin superfamily)
VTTLDDPISEALRPEERDRYTYPQVRVIQPGGPYFKMPWERIHKVSIATMTVNMALDLEDPSANDGGTRLEAVTKDQLNTGLTGQIRYRVSESNLYAFLFGIKKPFVHVMAYFVSVLRQRIANFEAKPGVLQAAAGAAGPGSPSVAAQVGGALGDIAGVSINDLRKNLRDLNEYMDHECRATPARYGVIFDASLITGIDPPAEVESALAAINTAHNQVSSDISLAQAAADQRVVQSRRAVEIETLRAQAEIEPIKSLAAEITSFGQCGPEHPGRLPAERAAGTL